MQQRFSAEVPLLLDRVQVTHCSLLQAHERLGASLSLFECEALIQPRHCKQAIKVVRTLHELAASLHAYVLPAQALHRESSHAACALGVLLPEAHSYRALAPPAGMCLPGYGHGTQWRNAARTRTLYDAGTPRPAGGVCRESRWCH